VDDDGKKLLELERHRRLVLADRIARAIAVLDPDPDPGQLDMILNYCRFCRLLIERYRATATLVEHDPVIEAIMALSTSVARENRGAGKDEI